MRNIITSFILILSATVFGQTSTEFLENGIVKHEKQDFKGAIKDYTRAKKIKMPISIEELAN